MNDYRFGNFLCMLREQKGLTQANLAQMLDVTAAAVSKWENGESKPRIETLFRLAQILGVTAEELMAGEFKKDETVTEQQEEENKKALLLSQFENLLTVEVRARRIAADFIDLIIAIVPIFLFMIFMVTVGITQTEPTPGVMLSIFSLFPLTIFACAALHLFRDCVGKGRSLGCRALGLVILNENTGERAHTKQFLLRNLCMFVGGVDDLIMLITGKSIGDRCAQTVTVSKKQLKELQLYIEKPTEQPPVFTDPKKNKRSVVAIAASYLLPVLFIVVFFLIFHFAMTHSEHYTVAYDYLVNSESFQALHVGEDSIACTANNVSGSTNSADAEVVFSVEGKHYTVICHKEGEAWTVCRDCTEFE